MFNRLHLVESMAKRGEVMKKTKKSVIANLLKASMAISLVASLVACSEDSPTNSGENAIPGNSGGVTSLTDARDGKTYKAVTIGPVVWMAENLNYVTESSRCYDDNLDLCEQYGRLYILTSMTGGMIGEDFLSICPEGWRLPRLEESKSLVTYGASALLASGTNSTGFSALLSGYMAPSEFDGSDKFDGMGSVAYIMADERNPEYFIEITEAGAASTVYKSRPSFFHFAIRCVKQIPVIEPGSVISGVLNDPRDGKNYKTVKIGSLNWMAENLNYHDQSLLGKSYCYDNNPDYCEAYGRLYLSDALEGLCPDGWHIPKDIEWFYLNEFVGDNKDVLRADGSNDYGFSVQLAGFMPERDSFRSVNFGAAFWSAEGGIFSVAGGEGVVGLSVRCVQN